VVEIMAEFLKTKSKASLHVVWITGLLVLLSACSSQQKLGVVAASDSNALQSQSNGSRYETRQVYVPAAAVQLLEAAELDIADAQYESAKNKLARAQRIAPSYSRIYLLWGVLYRNEGDMNKANQMFNRALSLATSKREKQAVLDSRDE
jgi:Flp pilus assembly protein TadD